MRAWTSDTTVCVGTSYITSFDVFSTSSLSSVAVALILFNFRFLRAAGAKVFTGKTGISKAVAVMQKDNYPSQPIECKLVVDEGE